VSEQFHGSLLAPVRRVTAPNVHVAFSPHLEKAVLPDRERVVQAVREVLDRRPVGV
jgi:pyruvate/2-oxoglutarate/acetoin dehydrogenase E1 component